MAKAKKVAKRQPKGWWKEQSDEAVTAVGAAWSSLTGLHEALAKVHEDLSELLGQMEGYLEKRAKTLRATAKKPRGRRAAAR
jgi:hypothetical protein